MGTVEAREPAVNAHVQSGSRITRTDNRGGGRGLETRRAAGCGDRYKTLYIGKGLRTRLVQIYHYAN